jgi:hypothetical protein
MSDQAQRAADLANDVLRLQLEKAEAIDERDETRERHEIASQALRALGEENERQAQKLLELYALLERATELVGRVVDLSPIADERTAAAVWVADYAKENP